MKELTQSDFEELCRCPAVAEQLGSLDTVRRAAVATFWRYLAAALLLGAAAGVTLYMSGWKGWSIFFGGAIFLMLLALGSLPLGRLSEDLKQPVMDKVAEQSGLTYAPDGFDPPVYPQARKILFGSWLTQQSFTDLFHGTDDDNRNYAVYEAHLLRQQGKQVDTVFRGQMYALQRRPGARGTTVIVPDRGFFNLFKPDSSMERVDLGFDSALDAVVEVYSTEPADARQLLSDADFRRRLLDFRKSGKIFAFLDPSEALFAVTGKDKFETGSMFRSTPGRERVQRMFDEVCAAVGNLRYLKTLLG